MEITEQMVISKLQCIERGKAAGPDGIKPDYLKEIESNFSEVFGNITDPRGLEEIKHNSIV